MTALLCTAMACIFLGMATTFPVTLIIIPLWLVMRSICKADDARFHQLYLKMILTPPMSGAHRKQYSGCSVYSPYPTRLRTRHQSPIICKPVKTVQDSL